MKTIKIFTLAVLALIMFAAGAIVVFHMTVTGCIMMGTGWWWFTCFEQGVKSLKEAK